MIMAPSRTRMDFPDSFRDFLEEKYHQYNQRTFIEEDPILIPHSFNQKEDVEISGYLAATIAWGRRDIIIRNAKALMARMDLAPFDFVMHASEAELGKLEGFVHRTFNGIDARSLVLGLRHLYRHHSGMEAAFIASQNGEEPAFSAIEQFRALMLSTAGFAARSAKHIASPARGSSAKRINMFLRWMVRKDNRGVDLGLWNCLKPGDLICPLDVHTGNVARKLDLLHRKQNDWKAALELTRNLRKLDPKDPVKYDFSLFGLGIYEGF